MPVHDRHHVDVTARHWNVRDIRRPDLVRRVDGVSTKQVWVCFMSLVRHTCARLWMEWRQAQLPHQSPDPADAHRPACVRQRQLQTPTAVIGMPFIERRQGLFQHDVHIRRPRRPGTIVRGSRDREQRTLVRDRQRCRRIDHRLSFGSIQGDSFSCRKSRSIVSSPILRCKASGSAVASVGSSSRRPDLHGPTLSDRRSATDRETHPISNTARCRRASWLRPRTASHSP